MSKRRHPTASSLESRGDKPIRFAVDGRELTFSPESGGLSLAEALRSQSREPANLDALDAVRVDTHPTTAAVHLRELDGRSVTTTEDAGYSLVDCGGLNAGQRHLLPLGVHVLGRGADVALRVPSLYVSRRHCQLEVAGDGITVTDLGSKNGTRVAGRQVTGRTRIDPGEMLDAGGELLCLHGPRSFDACLLDHLFRQAMQDTLTGLWSRRYALHALEEELALLAGSSHATSTLLIDLDHFKDVNDTLGHAAGDELLVQAARLMAATLHEPSLIGRLGGDEFLVVMPYHEPTEAAEQAEHLRREFEATDFVLPSRSDDEAPDAPVSQTISLGLACARGKRVDPAEILKAADSCLYESKRCGRNRLTRHPEVLGP